MEVSLVHPLIHTLWLSLCLVTHMANWKCRQHVTRDLDAYVCLFEKCEKPEELYTRSEMWLKHMRQHTLYWRCNAKSHGLLHFDTSIEYVKHMQEEHKSPYTEYQLSFLAERR